MADIESGAEALDSAGQHLTINVPPIGGKGDTMETKKYTVSFGSDSEEGAKILSNSGDALKHGEELLGNASGGRVTVSDMEGRAISLARYTPANGGSWFILALYPIN